MGGHIFTRSVASGHPVLQTPRMNPDKYNELKQIYMQRVSACFPKAASVEVGIEAPEKQDHGDIDIIVFDRGYVSWAEVAEAVGAVAWIKRGRDDEPSCSLAVRLDGERSAEKCVEYICPNSNDPRTLQPDSGISDQHYAQIDINQIDPERRHWSMFASSYGDLQGILGAIVKNFGFTINERGLRLRFQEYDDAKREKWENFPFSIDEGRFRLSDDPVKVMQCLGLDVPRYNDGFISNEEIFQWLATCPMVSEHCCRHFDHLPATREEKSNSRGRNRDLYNLFFDTWLPIHLEAKRNAKSTSTGNDGVENGTQCTSLSQLRHQYRCGALSFFKKQQEYSTLHAAFVRKRDNELVARKLRNIIVDHHTVRNDEPDIEKSNSQSIEQYKGPSKKILTEIVTAFRRNVTFSLHDRQPTILDHSKPTDQSELYTFLEENSTEIRDLANVKKFVVENFDRVKELGRARAKEKHTADITLKKLDQAHQVVRDLAHVHTSGQAIRADVLAQAAFEYIAVLKSLTGHAIALPALRAHSTSSASGTHAAVETDTDEARVEPCLDRSAYL